MNSPARNALRNYSPPISRKKRPIRHGVYVNSKNALKVRGNRVAHLVNKAVEQMPWLRDEHLPALRQWAELEVIRRAAFAGIVQNGALRTDIKEHEVSVRRLVHDHRQICMAQLVFERELGMTPLARAQLSESHESNFDLVALMAQQVEPEPVEAEPSEPESER